MELRDGWWSVSSFNLVYHCKLIKTGCDALEVDINCLVLLLPVFELCFQLFDMTPTWFCIGRCQCRPCFKGSCRTRHKRLQGRRDGAYESTVDQLVLAFPNNQYFFFGNVYCGLFLSCILIPCGAMPFGKGISLVLLFKRCMMLMSL
ncbi:hypothetical protein N665_0598s0006 [Sinapis alba]|nr:hypothetical protein N665_0598s0006 [Sinapis alba]